MALSLATLGGCGWEPTPQKKTPPEIYAFGIRIAADTTQITEPRLPNGTPDYAAAINAATGMGVNLDNNAVRDLAPLLGMNLSPSTLERLSIASVLPREERFAFGFSRERFDEYRRLEVETAAEGEIDSAFEAFQVEAEMLERGYCSTIACPIIAQWLGTNEGDLRAVAEALTKPRFWVPLEDGKNLYQSKDISLGGFRDACRALGARASLRLGDGTWALASADILSAERLGGLLSQSTLALAQVTAAGCIGEGNRALRRAAADPSLDVAAAKSLIRDLEELPPIGNFELVVQHERFIRFAGIFFLREAAGEKDASAWREKLEGEGQESTPQGLYRLEVSSIDWNEAMSLVNRSWDLAREIVWSSTETTAAQARESLQEGLRFTAETESTLEDSHLSRLLEDTARNPEARLRLTRAFVDAAGLLPTGFNEFLRAIHEPLAERELGLVALALATHRKEVGRLPAAIETLAPAYLDRMPPATRFGHVLKVNRGESGELALTLVPQVVGVTGSRSFCIDTEGRDLVLGDGREPGVIEGRCSDPAP